MTHEFTPWPKTPRLFRPITVTEKIDGTNAAVHIADDGTVTAQSRNRIITPDADNYGFAAWVSANAFDLGSALGTGLHFGEWWGVGIQRGYGLFSRRFSLFNTDRHADLAVNIGGVDVQPVPVLGRGPMDTELVSACLETLVEDGSRAAPGFLNPEGVCVFHHATRQVFKVTLDKNDAGKWEV